jgi:hypothetical protein
MCVYVCSCVCVTCAGTICVLCRDVDIGVWANSFTKNSMTPSIMTIVKDKKDIIRKHGNHTYRLVDSW